MTEQQPSPKLERRLERLRADYEAAKARIAEVGFTCEGSLIERYTTCNNPNCRCSDPQKRHGPYWQLSWKQGGKTVSKLLSAEDAALYQEWIANDRQLRRLIQQMRQIAAKATELKLEQAAAP